ncbi:hypothetical protein M5K25_002278 [Dendrobium thyrsiflorum]|uniref:Uncharacterized protein n=1 Tax=Dendrobium thyrsiflorum TaxID=117978 RepID=A0ABD0VU54_DENTH
MGRSPVARGSSTSGRSPMTSTSIPIHVDIKGRSSISSDTSILLTEWRLESTRSRLRPYPMSRSPTRGLNKTYNMMEIFLQNNFSNIILDVGSVEGILLTVTEVKVAPQSTSDFYHLDVAKDDRRLKAGRNPASLGGRAKSGITWRTGKIPASLGDQAKFWRQVVVWRNSDIKQCSGGTLALGGDSAKFRRQAVARRNSGGDRGEVSSFSSCFLLPVPSYVLFLKFSRLFNHVVLMKIGLLKPYHDKKRGDKLIISLGIYFSSLIIFPTCPKFSSQTRANEGEGRTTSLLFPNEEKCNMGTKRGGRNERKRDMRSLLPQSSSSTTAWLLTIVGLCGPVKKYGVGRWSDGGTTSVGGPAELWRQTVVRRTPSGGPIELRHQVVVRGRYDVGWWSNGGTASVGGQAKLRRQAVVRRRYGISRWSDETLASSGGPTEVRAVVEELIFEISCPLLFRSRRRLSAFSKSQALGRSASASSQHLRRGRAAERRDREVNPFLIFIFEQNSSKR